ncbi:MAG: hypothetical protein QOE97_350 [Pseudonocardiales bacterium]|nr:hypothetical protein [Pseudonocardiales bacterium]
MLVVLLCIGLFVRSYRNAGPDAAGPLPTPSSSVSPASTRSASPSPSDTFFPKPGDKVTLGNKVLSVEPGGFTFHGGTPHAVVITATSSAAIGRVGYLIPTSNDHSYGVVDGVGTSWSVKTDAYGKPQYALAFVQAGGSGAAITCSVSVDGKVVNSSTTSGPYGRTICVG